MKHLIRRGLGVALAVVMATGLLSSCGSDYDPVKDIMGYKGSTVLFTVNGQDVTAEQYLFWLAQQADTTYSYASMMQSDDSGRCRTAAGVPPPRAPHQRTAGDGPAPVDPGPVG